MFGASATADPLRSRSKKAGAATAPARSRAGFPPALPRPRLDRPRPLHGRRRGRSGQRIGLVPSLPQSSMVVAEVRPCAVPPAAALQSLVTPNLALPIGTAATELPETATTPGGATTAPGTTATVP